MIHRFFRRIILLACLIFLVIIGAKAISHYQTGADIKSIFNSPPNENNEAIKKIHWRENEKLVAHPNIRYAIGKDLYSAWHWLNKSNQILKPVFLEDYFHQDVIDKILDQFHTQSIPIHKEILSQDLELLHLSLDKSTAIIKDHACVTIQRELQEGREVNLAVDTISYTAFLVYSDGLWKIRNWISESLHSTSDIIDTSEAHEQHLESVKAIKGINYYPQDYSWHYFWDSLTTEILQEDFTIIRELGLNTIRIFIPFQSFSNPEKESFYYSQLNHVLDIANSHNLKVLPTLFDFPVGFDLEQYANYSFHLDKLIPFAKNHPALLAWNIKNEPDLDFEHHGRQQVLDFLSFCIDRVKTLDSEHPVTISWSKMEYLPFLEHKLDFLSFHLYLEDSNWTNTLNSHKFHFNKPILLEEFGRSTRSGFSNILGSTELAQSQYILDVIHAANANQIPWMIWTLYDFNQIPSGVFKKRPWIISKQSHFGLIRKDGKPKEIYRQLKSKITQ